MRFAPLSLLVVSSAIALALAACGSSTSEQGDTTAAAAPAPEPAAPPAAPEPAPPSAPVAPELSIRIIHAAAGAATKNLGVTYATGGDTPGPLASDLAFGATSAYTSATLPPGMNAIGLSVRAEGIEPLSFAGSIAAGEPHSAVVFSSPDAPDRLAATVLRDAPQAPDAGKTNVRFVHAVLGWDTVDVCAPGDGARAPGTPVFPNLRYSWASQSSTRFDGYIEMPAGLAKLQVRQANAEAPCSGRVLGAVELAPPAGGTLDAQNVTLIGVGRASGRPAVPRAVLLCLDSPAASPSCTSLPMRAR